MKLTGLKRVAAALAVVAVSVALVSCGGKGKKQDAKKTAAEQKDGEKTEETVEIQIVNTKEANAASDFIYETTVDGSGVVIERYIGSRGNVIIPEEIEGYKVTVIGKGSFSKCKNIASVVLPSTVTVIRESAFEESSLREITLPSSLTSIEAAAFNSSSLAEIKLPQGITVIPKKCFSSTKLTSVELPEGVTSVGESAFDSCNISTFNIPASLKTVGYHAFASNPLKDVEIASRDVPVTYGNGAFASCNSKGTMSIALRKKLNGSGYKNNYYEKDISCCKDPK